jgi:hypothetical protein
MHYGFARLSAQSAFASPYHAFSAALESLTAGSSDCQVVSSIIGASQ